MPLQPGASAAMRSAQARLKNVSSEPAMPSSAPQRGAAEVPVWRTSSRFSLLERDVLEYAEAMSETPLTVTDELSERLLQALKPAGLLELTSFIALANFYARSNIAVGIEAEGLAASCNIKPLAVASPATA